jgi:DNA-binding response OmpR family regulator
VANVLIIEDDEVFLGLLRFHLTSAGHTVQVAQDAEVALRTVLADPPDLILLDLNVPYLNGFEMLEALRTDPLSRQVPVMVITGRDDDESYLSAQRFGIAGYFTKPVEREKLLEAVGAALAFRPHSPHARVA